jgi:Phycobilisome protein
MIYSTPIRALAACEGRYPTDEEEGIVLSWAGTLQRRLHTANNISQKETAIVRRTIDAMRAKYTRFATLHERAFEKGERDMQLILRYVAQAIVADDDAMPREKLYIWYGTIIRSLGLTPQFMVDGCTQMMEACRRELPAEAFAVAEPYLQQMIADVPNFPEPYKPLVE